MKIDFRFSQGNPAMITDALTNNDNPVDLTGASVAFNYQMVDPEASATQFTGTATVTNPTNGEVAYTFQSSQTMTPGVYRAQWVVTNSGNVTNFPTGYIHFEIVATVPINPEDGILSIAETFEGVRAITGDHDPEFRKYENEAIASVVRTVVRSGKLGRCFTITADRRGISPTITRAADFGVLLYHAAKMLVAPESGEYQYRTRALAEKFGDQRHFLQELENQLYDLQNPGGVFVTFQSFYGWVNALTGLNIWSYLTDMRTQAPVSQVVIGRAGIYVNSIGPAVK